MHGHDPGLSAAENYRAFAEDARGRSPLYESLAGAVAADAAILRFLGALPPEKRQPNLLFAAARYLQGEPAGLAGDAAQLEVGVGFVRVDLDGGLKVVDGIGVVAALLIDEAELVLRFAVMRTDGGGVKSG